MTQRSTLTPAEVAQARQLIAKLETRARRCRAHLELDRLTHELDPTERRLLAADAQIFAEGAQTLRLRLAATVDLILGAQGNAAAAARPALVRAGAR